MRKLIVLLLFVSFCGGTTDETVPPIETTTTSTTSTSTSTTTTTSSTTTTVPETTTTTVNIEDVVLPTITFPNCPKDQVTGDEFELFIKVTAGNYDLNYLRISQWKNEEYDGRVYYEKSNPDSGFPFPNAEESVEFSVSLFDNDKNQAINYEVFISISDESDAFFEVEERCNVSFNNVPVTTTTSSTTTTTTLNNVNETYTGSGDNLVLIPQFSQLVVAEIQGNQAENIFQVKPYFGETPFSSLIITSDPYSGVTPLNFSDENPDALQVKAVGEWSIVIRSVLTAPIFSGNSISGTGDTVIQFPDNNNTFQDLTISGNQAEQIFQVKPYACDGSPKSSLVITSEPYDGTIRSLSGACYLVVKAVGEWTISR